jgi:hypothetical protein
VLRPVPDKPYRVVMGPGSRLRVSTHHPSTGLWEAVALAIGDADPSEGLRSLHMGHSGKQRRPELCVDVVPHVEAEEGRRSVLLWRGIDG